MQQISVRITRDENAKHYGVEKGDVVQVPLEDYVAGVVASEVGNASTEAARAQAVAARTFAWPFYHKGLVITDASSTHQAFRAPRISAQLYPRAIQAAQDTAGQLLRYHGKVIDTCSYSDSNGGRTVSSAERWGGARAWLISQDDPWDAAAGGSRTGHGVGMSQRGAKYAASVGIGYREILAFYYPGTEIWREEGEAMNEKATKVVNSAQSQMGSPYVFGAWGDTCTTSLRVKYAGYNPDHKDAIYKGCQALNGSRVSCDGCKWQGCLAFDCRGFVHWCFLQAGINISGAGATSQYNAAANWAKRGTIDQIPDLVCAVYKHADGKMIHTGVHIGGGQIIHCSAGVQAGKVTDKGWTHFAVPVGMYSQEELAAAGVVQIKPVLRKGDKGAAVEQLQQLLTAKGYDCGSIDGAYGAMTGAAVRCYQADHGLVIDGVVGDATWAMLGAADVPAQVEHPTEATQPEATQTGSEAIVQSMRNVYEQLGVLRSELGALIEATDAVLRDGQKGGDG